MARPDEASRSRSAQVHRSDIPRASRGGLPRGIVRHTGAALLGYLWASFLVAASGTETLLARLSKRR
jgi:hypothetical protein